MTSFLAYAISNNVGFAMLSGASVRYRFYTRWGITAEELSRIVFSYVVTFWLGLLLIGGLSLAMSPLPHELGVSAPAVVSAGRLAADVGEPGVCVAAGLRLGPIRFRRVELPLPSPRLAVAQLAISILEWTIAGRGPVRAPAAGQRPVSHASGSVPRVTAARARQPYSRRHGRIRGADGAPLEAVHSVDDAAAGADCVSRGVLSAPAFRCGCSCSWRTSCISDDRRRRGWVPRSAG